MNKTDMKGMLRAVRDGQLDVDEALQRLQAAPFEDLGYAKIDHHRGIRQGVPEVIYGSGKAPDQICGIARHMLERGAKDIIVSRLAPEAAEQLAKECPLKYHPLPRFGVVNRDNGFGAGFLASRINQMEGIAK